MTFEDKLQVLPATPPNLFGTQLGTQTPLRRVKLLFYMGKGWRG